MIQSKAVLTVNAIAKKLSANDVLAFLHRVVVIDNRNLSVVYRGILEDFLESAVIDTGNSSVVYRFQNKVAISVKIWYKKYMILFCRIS